MEVGQPNSDVDCATGAGKADPAGRGACSTRPFPLDGPSGWRRRAAAPVRLPGEPAGFTRSLICRCMDMSPMPVDCTEAGAAAPIAPLDQLALWSAPALSTLSVGAPLVCWTQAGKEFCIAYSVASAVHHCGDEAAARRIANLAERVLQQPAGTDRVTWLAVECRQQLQPAWSVRSLDTTVDPLALLSPATAAARA